MPFQILNMPVVCSGFEKDETSMKKVFKKLLFKFGLYPSAVLLRKRFQLLHSRKEDRAKRNDKIFSSIYSKNDLCFDIGANEGDITEIFLKPAARVVVEPQRICLKILQKRYGGSFRVIIVNKGVAEKTQIQKSFYL